MGHIITICNPKGGTAKTSTAVNLACAITAVHKKVLLVDFDPQRSASVALGYEYADIEHNIGTALLDNVPIKSCITHYLKGGFDVILSSDDLVALPSTLHDKIDSHLCLSNALSKIKDNYDFIIIDTPACLNLITINAMCAADSLVVPVCTDMFALTSMSTLLEKYHELKSQNQAHCRLLGIVITLYDPILPMSQRIHDELAHAFRELLFNTAITYNPKISEATGAAIPVLLYDKSSLGSRQYLSLAGEILKKLRDLS